jgi:hypothetical protein
VDALSSQLNLLAFELKPELTSLMGAKLVVVVVVVVVVVMAVPGGVLELPIDETPEEQVEVERTLFMDGTGDAQADESFICFSKT